MARRRWRSCCNTWERRWRRSQWCRTASLASPNFWQSPRLIRRDAAGALSALRPGHIGGRIAAHALARAAALDPLWRVGLLVCAGAGAARLGIAGAGFLPLAPDTLRRAGCAGHYAAAGGRHLLQRLYRPAARAGPSSAPASLSLPAHLWHRRAG